MVSIKVTGLFLILGLSSFTLKGTGATATGAAGSTGASGTTAPPLTECPSYASLVDVESMRDFKIESYQGEWYQIMTNEPTEPTFCTCDRITWTLNNTNANGHHNNDYDRRPLVSRDFKDELDLTCAIGGAKFPLYLPLIGKTSNNTHQPGNQLEGNPPTYPLISNQILYVHKLNHHDPKKYLYQAAIIFSCAKNYAGQALFTSLQFFSRSFNVTTEYQNQLIRKAKSLGVPFDESSLAYKFANGANCAFAPSRLDPCNPACPANCKCVNGLNQGFPGVPTSYCQC